jgi:hypothetical protein
MSKGNYLKVWVPIILILIAILFAYPGCTTKNDTGTYPEYTEGDIGSGGGGSSSGDDDTSDDDDDDDDDDDADDDDDDEVPLVAVVYGNNSQNTGLQAFFAAFDIDAVFVLETAVDTFDFSPYSLILVTETCEFFESYESVAIENANKKVLGIYTGGAVLFGQLGGFANLGTGTFYTLDQVTALNPGISLWNSPYPVEMTDEGVVDISSLTISGLGHSMVGAPSNVISYANITGTTDRGIITGESIRYYFWGPTLDTNLYTTDGLRLLANLIYFIAG